MPRRIKRPQDKENAYKQLTEGDYKVFNTMKDVFLLAACIGFSEGERKSFEKVGGEIPWSVFRGDTDEPIIDSIAMSETNDVLYLLRDEETYDRKFKIVEEYSNYGMEVLYKRIIDSPGDPVDNLVALILEAEKSDNVEELKPSDFLDDLF
jgi:dnd system-associated protein 4